MHRYQTAVALNTGGTAEIYKAYDPALQRYVALKFLRRNDPSLVERMFREARAQARLEHEGICKVYEVGEVDGRPYIAMQYIEGEELGVAAREMTLEDKVQVMVQVAEAVHVAHKEGLIHRDLKPANVMVQRSEDGRFKPIVVDFGLVWEVETENESMTQVGQVLGTPPYLAPEQAEGRREQLDRRTDVYSLGATLFHLLAGRPPFVGERNVELLMKTVHEEAPLLRRLEATIPADLETIVAKCLEKEPQRRYESAQALVVDLRSFLAGEPISARPASLSYRLRKKLRKHRALVAVSVIAALLLIGAAAFFFVSRLRDERRHELEQRYAEIGKDVDWTMRVEHMSSGHDIRSAKQQIDQRIARLKEDLETVGLLGQGPVHYALGRCYLVLLENDRARQHLEKAWQLEYRNPEVAYGLGLVLGRQYEKQLSRAKSERDRLLREANIRQIEKTYRDPAIEYLRSGRGAETVATEYVEALLAFYEKRYDDALAKVEAAIARLPWLYEAKVLEGNILTQRGEDERLAGEVAAAWASFHQAEPAYRQALASAGSDPQAYVGLCEMATSMIRLEAQGPGEEIATYREKALEACDQAIHIDPELAAPQVRKALALQVWASYLTWTGEDPSTALGEARELARRGVELAPEDHLAHSALGAVYLQQGEFMSMAQNVDPRPVLDLAAASYQRALALHPNNAVVLNSLGGARLHRAFYEFRNGMDPSEALLRGIEELETGLEVTPDSFNLHYNLGNAHITLGAWEYLRGRDFSLSTSLAIEHLARSVDINPAFDWGLLELGDAYGWRASYAFYTGDDPDDEMGQAIRLAQQAIELNPNIGEFYNRLTTFYGSQAYYLLSRGEDPSVLLDQARQTIDTLGERMPGQLAPHAQRVSVEALAIRWAIARGESAAVAIAEADRALRIMEGFPQDIYYYEVVVDYLAWRAYWSLLNGSDPEPSIKVGLGLIEKALELEPDSPVMLSNRGTLRMLQAHLETDTEARAICLAEAEIDLERALVMNRWLASEIEPWLAETRRLAGKGPKVQENVD